MATRTPLVLVNGQIQQLQSGDTIAVAAALYDARSGTNGEASAVLVIGAPIYVSGANQIKRAQANAASTAGVEGLMLDVSTAAGASGLFVVNGILVATTTQWDAITGGSGGLVAGTLYFLDPANPGRLTTTAPSTTGQLVVKVGRALSTTDMDVNIGDPILL